ncbi:integrase arm-type DNA-binding domain-containing protein [Advenella alkanexedens]|uniref:Integrase arm-type DNA-binding domain-containing protein n=1 Tax=Advenella alkanexedens TaxID=1481665 RepID=A0ABS6NQU0_9BURK|nr:integrase arm-type DNA-binding domain-containing protein [Advenella alkanexedens]MBV4397950.1 integrase arm-type DNA-binding domain-containing protein [Advenella alkanexedens]
MALNDVQIRAAKPTDKQYKLTDGEGMYLLVHSNGSKYWRLNYRFGGKQKTLALGVYPATPLAAAREKRAQAKQMLASNIDPGEQKKQEQFEQNNGDSFEEVARAWHANNKKWSEAHSARILQSLVMDVFPTIGKTSIKDLKTLDLLVPIRKVTSSGRLEVASRLQQRITSIMRYAVQSGLIDYNPAQDIAGTIPASKVKHRPALDFERIPELLERISNYKGRPLTQMAVELSLLVFIRSSELRFGRWSEVDFERAIWTIPAEREAIEGAKFSHRGAKMRTPHLVPLSKQAINVLRRIYQWTGNHELIFTGDNNPKNAMSENTVNKALRTMGYDTKTEVCGHGFRTMACSALIESGLWSKDAVERQMSHQERNSVRAAYIYKAEHLDERRLMMQWWADFLDANKVKAVSPFEFTNT